MKIESKQIIEIIGITAVVLSLIFVGVQVQQGAEATRSATVLQLKDAWVQFNLAQSTSLELNQAFQAIDEAGFQNASFTDRALVGAYYRTLFHNSSNAYYQFRIGTLDEDLWTPHLIEIQTFPDDAVVVRIWQDWKHLYDKQFQDLVDSTMKENLR